MTIGTITQPPFMVDTLPEMSTAWPENSFAFCAADGSVYQLKSGAFIKITQRYLNKPYDVTTTSGAAVIQLTDDGLSTGNALFNGVPDFIQIRFTSNDPNFGASYVLSNSNKTLTITAVKQAFTGITLLSTSVLGSVALAAAANGTALKVLVQGVPV